jgi:hypothetical protein
MPLLAGFGSSTMTGRYPGVTGHMLADLGDAADARSSREG